MKNFKRKERGILQEKQKWRNVESNKDLLRKPKEINRDKRERREIDTTSKCMVLKTSTISKRALKMQEKNLQQRLKDMCFPTKPCLQI